ncbi:MAG: hypothetical protein NC210_03420 [[Clostridium] fimetarium]|nr:hypothetical protein [Alistipes timonensis]MCM1405452.1 hypothetical protein [[Clostridium] fimetarium]
MKHLAATRMLILCAIAMTLCGAGIGNMYVQKKGDSGWMFHIFSQKMPLLYGDAGKHMEYDYTFVEKTDSVSLLATVVCAGAPKPVDMAVSYGDARYNRQPDLIYAKPKGEKTEYRLRLMLPFETWDAMYGSVEPFVVSFGFSSGRDTMVASYGLTGNKWRKNKEKIAVIIGQIKLNTGK